jgi:hypothetical protein
VTYPAIQHSPKKRKGSVFYDHRESHPPVPPRWSKKSLEGELLSVDLFLEKTASNKARDVLVAAIVRFRDHHAKDATKRPIEKMLSADVGSDAQVKAITESMVCVSGTAV